ncbi:DUF1542 domain-containing protein [Streptococcus pyogenes]|uniref:DUF1542 domain-containing protein n=2 Tax=Streptococcus pyogenes TaxID=1314 RepID=UPI00109BBD97|nr:DUF1542 domain-containing protein [Streptococcus pyogenes]QCK45876.1 DUF1542 domain-containing protein [Streptococcus pyogenes]VGR76742.1 extracellular matrix binding protein [Streptococcus pyogenes]
MFLKHHDVKQKNWRMRKVKKVFVSSCMLLTVGLGVAVPTGFSQSNGVMVVKAAEVPAVDEVKTDGNPNNMLDYSYHLTFNDSKAGGRYYTNDKSVNPTDLNLKYFYVHGEKVRENDRLYKYEGGKEIHDSSIGVYDQRYKIVSYMFYSGSKAMTTVYRVNSKPLKPEHNYSFEFGQDVNEAKPEKANTFGLEVGYGFGTKYQKGDVSSYKAITPEHLGLKDVKVIENGKESDDLSIKVRANEKKKITFKSEKSDTPSLLVYTRTKGANTRQDYINFRDFQFYDVTEPDMYKSNSGVAHAGHDKVTLELDTLKGRDALIDQTVTVYNGNETLGTKAIILNSKDKKLTIDAKSLKTAKTGDVIKVKILQSDSKKYRETTFKVTFDPKDVQEQKKLLTDTKATAFKINNTNPWLSNSEKSLANTKVNETFAQEFKKLEEDLNSEGLTLDSLKEKASVSVGKINSPEQLEVTKARKIKEAEAAINAKYDKVNQQLSEDKTIKASEKPEFEKELAKLKEEALKGLSGATDLRTLNERQYNGEKSLTYETGKPISEQKTAALDELQKKHAETLMSIKEDTGLSKSEKESQKAEANNAFEAAKARINSNEVDDADKLQTAKIEGQNAITNAYVKGDLEKYKKAKLTELEEAITKEREVITTDASLTTLQRKAKLKELEEVAQTAKTAINEPDNADDVLQALQVHVPKVKAVHTPGKIEDVKKSATDSLNKILKETLSSIEGDKSLTQAEKDKQVQDAQKVFDESKKKIEKATDADKVLEFKNKAEEAIPETHQKGNLVGIQTAQKAELKKVHDETVAEIEKDNGLTKAEKNAQKTKAAEALKKGEEAVQSATTADEAIAKAEENKKIITVTHEKGDLEKVKDKAKEGLTATYNETVKNIKADSGLTADEQKKQLEGTEKAYKAGEQAITTAENADKVGEVLPVEKKKVSDEYKAGDLPKVKQAQKDALQKVHDETIAQVEKDKGLTTEQKDAQKAKAAEALKKGQDAVEAAPKADEAIKAGTDNQQPIKDSYIPGKLDDVQTKATADLKKAHTETVAKINGDDTLDKATKEAQVKEADKALAAGKDAITKADDADKVSTAVTEHTPKIKAAHKTGDLKKAQEEANTALDKAAEKEREEINNDITLTAKDKEQQLKEVETALTKAKDNVKAAKTADAINDARDKGVATIDAVHKAGQDLGARKSGQVAKLEEAAKATKDKISADPTLTSKEKEEQSKAVDAELKKAIEAVNAADTADKVDDALGKGVTDIKNQHKSGDPVEARRGLHNKSIDEVAQATKDAITADTTLTEAEKEIQRGNVDKEATKAKEELAKAKDADALDKAYGDGVTSIKNQHKSGDPIEARRGLHNKSIDEVAQATKDAITADTTLTEAEKETQRGNVDKEATKAKEELAKAKDADALDKAYGDGVTSIKNQHKSGKGLDVRKAEHKKALEAVAKRVTAEIEADPTLTPEVREQQKAEVQKELELATDKIAEAKDADEADKAYGDGVTAIENAHVIGKGIEARKDLAKKDLAEAVAKTKALIIEDKTLTDDQRKEQLSGVDTEYAKGIENIDAAKDAAGVDKAYSDGVRDILAQYKEGQNLDDRRNAAKEFLLKEADKVTKLINDDPTLTHDQKVDQINKVEQAKLDAIKSVDDAQTADAINDALGKGIENINNQYQHGDGVDVRKATAKGDLEKEAAKVKALIAKDPTLTQADKDKQTAAVDAAKNTAIAAVDKATTADGVNQELGKGITAINKAYRPGEAVKARKGAAKADLEKEAAKVKALIAKDPTLTQADKDKQTAAVDAAKNTAIAAVDKATTAEGINQELGKGITAINKAYRPGEAVKARKEAAKADLEKEAAKVKALITNDPTLTKADKAKQTEAVAKALKAAIAAVDKATTAEGINQELGKGITAINKAYRPGEGVKARKEAAKADLEREAAKVREAIANDPTLTKADKAKQTEAVAKALKAAIAAVDKATTAEGINQELGKGITAINKAYRPGEGVKARKEAAKANLEKVAKETKALISGDRYLSETEKAVQKQAVEQALAKALGQVEAAKTVEAVKLAENLGTVAIRSAYVAGLAKDTDQATAALNEAKQAAIEALKQAAAETLAKITTDAKLTEAQKAEQSENVSLALKTAIATVRSAQSIASVKEAKDKGITAIRAAYVPNKAVAKSSSANHLPKSGDANSIVLVGLGVMSLLLGMVLYSKKKESKD